MHLAVGARASSFITRDHFLHVHHPRRQPHGLSSATLQRPTPSPPRTLILNEDWYERTAARELSGLRWHDKGHRRRWPLPKRTESEIYRRNEIRRWHRWLTVDKRIEISLWRRLVARAIFMLAHYECRCGKGRSNGGRRSKPFFRRLWGKLSRVSFWWKMLYLVGKFSWKICSALLLSLITEIMFKLRYETIDESQSEMETVIIKCTCENSSLLIKKYQT